MWPAYGQRLILLILSVVSIPHAALQLSWEPHYKSPVTPSLILGPQTVHLPFEMYRPILMASQSSQEDQGRTAREEVFAHSKELDIGEGS